MDEIAVNLFLLRGFPRYRINVYLMGDVLVDAGTRYAQHRILRQLKGHRVRAHALTHAHPDHQGSSKAICEALDIPLWCGERDTTAMETGNFSSIIPQNWITTLLAKLCTGPAHPVARQLTEGVEVAGFTVVETPGHSPGHIAFWREADRTLVLGDVLLNIDIFTGRVGLHEPLQVFTVDSEQNRQSARKIAELRPALVCFGHGPPLKDSDTFLRFVDNMR